MLTVMPTQRKGSLGPVIRICLQWSKSGTTSWQQNNRLSDVRPNAQEEPELQNSFSTEIIVSAELVSSIQKTKFPPQGKQDPPDNSELWPKSHHIHGPTSDRRNPWTPFRRPHPVSMIKIQDRKDAPRSTAPEILMPGQVFSHIQEIATFKLDHTPPERVPPDHKMHLKNCYSKMSQNWKIPNSSGMSAVQSLN